MKKLPIVLSRYSLLLLVALLFSGGPLAKAAQTDFSAAELDQMLAPIALYPDTILSHVLIAATYPLEIVQADRWAQANQDLEAEAAVAAVDNQDWDPSVKALVAFPQILQRMSENLAWTQRLGDAFLDDEAMVMDTIQQLRNKAYASGSLDRVEHLRVQREKEIIIIEPATERVVYVPVYDTRVVYGNWWWDDYPPIYWHYPAHYTFVGGFYWGPRIHVGSSFYFSSFQWHRRQVVYVDYHHHHRPHFHTGRAIARYEGARHWRHNPSHRRGVAYHNDRVRQHFGSNRPNSREQGFRENRQTRTSQALGRQGQNRGQSHVQRNNLHETERGRVRTSDPNQSDIRGHVNPRRSEAEKAANIDRSNTTRSSRADPRRSADSPGVDRSAPTVQPTPGVESKSRLERTRQQMERVPDSSRESRTPRASSQRENRVQGSSRRMEGVNRTSRPATQSRPSRAERTR